MLKTGAGGESGSILVHPEGAAEPAMTPPRPVAMITGAARRIGAVIARRLHAEGHDLVLHYRHSEAAMQALVAELEAIRPGSTLALQADLVDLDALPALVAQAVARFGRLDVLVNNASSYYATPVGGTTASQWDDLFATNARAPFFLSQAAAPHLKTAQGAIVNIASISGLRASTLRVAYGTSKAAGIHLTKQYAAELGEMGIRVNCVAPGPVRTKLAMAVHAPEIIAAKDNARRFLGPPLRAGPAHQPRQQRRHDYSLLRRLRPPQRGQRRIEPALHPPLGVPFSLAVAHQVKIGERSHSGTKMEKRPASGQACLAGRGMMVGDNGFEPLTSSM